MFFTKFFKKQEKFSKKVVSVLLTILLVLQIIGGVLFAPPYKQIRAVTNNWTFTTASNYIYDNTKIEISSSQAQLKATSAPDWYDTNWGYRRAITIDNTGNANDLTNYQVKVELTPSNFTYANASSTGADIRFTDTNGTTTIDFWIEKWDTTATSTIWIEVPSISASSNKTIYMYYGNSEANSVSSGDNTFEFFDTFDESLATDSYSRFDTGEVNAVFTGGGAGAWDEHIREKVWIIEDGGIFRMWYSGHDATGQGTSKIGYATSTDGITWTRYSGNPIISRPSQDQDPSVVKVSPTSYYMFVERDDNYIDLFTSVDGISWAPYVNNPVKTVATSPVVWKEGTTWYMLYEEMGLPLFSINLATSTDGRTWIDSPHNPVLAEAEHTVPNSIVKIDGVYHLYYHRNVDTWSAWHATSTDLINWTNRRKIFSDYTSPFTFITSDGRIKSYIWYLDGDKNYYLRYGKDALGSKWNLYDYNKPGNCFIHDNLFNLIGCQLLSETYQITNGIIESKVKIIQSEGSIFARAVGNTGDQFTNSSYGYSSGDFGAGDTWNLAITQDGVRQFTDTTQALLNEWLLKRFTLNGNNLEIERFRYSDMSANGPTVSGTLTKYSSGYIGMKAWTNRQAQIDWIFVRKYTSLEPSTSVGSEVLAFATDNPTIQPTAANSLTFTSLSAFTETATKNGGEIKYQISNDAGTTWYWWSGSGWATTTSGYSEANTASVINTNISNFPIGNGKFLFKAYLNSDGTQLVQLDNIEVSFSANTAPSATFDNDFSTWESGNVTVNYNLIDIDNDILNISQTISSGIEYSTDGSTWFDATDGGGISEGLTGLTSTSTPGTDHIFVWDSTTDLANIEDSTVYLRIRPNDGMVDADSWATSTVFGIDNVAPSSVGAPIFSIITTSSIEINKPSIVTENGSGLYQWQARRDNTTELGFNVTSTISVIDSFLSENTQYTYDVQFKDNTNNVSSYGTQVSKYTLVDTPTNLTASSVNTNSITLSVDNFPNDSSGFSGYYFENTTKGTNSGWIQTNSWQDTGLLCGTSYTYTVKYRNGDGIETDTISLTQSTNGCGGGGLPPGAFNPPSTPAPSPENLQGGFRVLINDGAETTDSRTVTLKLFAAFDAERMVISNNPDFSGPGTRQITYQSTYNWDICYWQRKCPDGIYTVYVKFYTQWGRASEVVSDSIILDTTPKEEVVPIEPEVEIPEEPKPSVVEPTLEIKPTEPVFTPSPPIPPVPEEIPTSPTPPTVIPAPIELEPDTPIFTSTQGDIVLKSIVPQKPLKLITGLKLKTSIKPSKPVQAIKVIIIFKKPKESSYLNDNFLSAFVSPVYAQVWQVAEYTLADEDGDGIFEGKIKLPEVAGEYVIRTTLYYEDGTIEDIETETLIDPKGYVYQIINGKKLRIPNAKISLYIFNSETDQFELWQAEKYGQKNPQITDKTGEYSFLVPEGKYYLTIIAPDYQNYQSKEFEVREGDIINKNIELTPIKKFNWKWLIFPIIFLVGLIIGIFVRLKKKYR